jgi:predicted NBD/HSP70 family sugar kinase
MFKLSFESQRFFSKERHLIMNKETRTRRIKLTSDHFDCINAIRRLGDNVTNTRIAATVNVSLTTVARAIDELKTDGAISGTDGKIQINPMFGCFASIHIGASGTRLVFLNYALECMGKQEFKEFGLANLYKELEKGQSEKPKNNAADPYFYYDKEDRSFDRITNRLTEISNIILNDIKTNYSTLPLLSVCIVLPGVIHHNSPEKWIWFSPNIPSLLDKPAAILLDKDTRNRLDQEGVPWFLEHDTQASLIFEREQLYKQDESDEKHYNKENIAVVSINSGIGSAFSLNGELHRGASYSSGEIGHLRFDSKESNEGNGTTEIYYQYYPDESASTPISEKCISFDEADTCYCRKQNCLENAFRVKVFNSKNLKEYSYKVNPKTLQEFETLNKHQFKILKDHLATLICILVDVLNVNVIIFSGTVIPGIPGLTTALKSLKYDSSLALPAQACDIIHGKQSHSSVAIGAAIAAFYKCKEENRGSDKPIRVYWQELK